MPRIAQTPQSTALHAARATAWSPGQPPKYSALPPGHCSLQPPLRRAKRGLGTSVPVRCHGRSLSECALPPPQPAGRGHGTETPPSLPSACPNPLPSRTCTAIRAEGCPKVRHRESRGCTALLAPHSWLPPAPHPTAAPSFPPSVPPRAGLGSGAPSQPGAAVSPARSPPLPLLPPRLPELPLMPERAPARPSPAAARSPESPASSASSPAGSAARSRSRSPRASCGVTAADTDLRPQQQMRPARGGRPRWASPGLEASSAPAQGQRARPRCHGLAGPR